MITFDASETLGISVFVLVFLTSISLLFWRLYRLIRHLRTRWHAVEGKLVSFERSELHRPYGAEKYVTAKLSYEYLIDQKKFHGHRVSLFDSFTIAWIRSDKLSRCVDEFERVFKASEPVRIYVDQGNHSVSVLVKAVPLVDIAVYFGDAIFGILASAGGLWPFLHAFPSS